MSEQESTVTSSVRRGREWIPIAFGLGNTLLLVMAGSALSRLATAAPQRAPAAPVLIAAVPEPQIPFQPLIPDAEPAPPTNEAASPSDKRERGPLRGGIGPLGPMRGPFATELDPNAPVMGPEWLKNPLPSIATGPKASTNGAQTAAAPNPKSDISSELPDERKVALSRLANPQPQVRTLEPHPKTVEVFADKPLSLHVALSNPPSGYEVGETVAIRLTANVECYAAVIAVDAAGKASTLFQSPAPGRSFACALRVGPSPGPEYIMAIGSVHPLNGPQVASVLRTAGGFPAVHTAVDGGTAPGAAWSLAVNQAAGLSGAQLKWQRYEWAVATDAFAARLPVHVAASPGPDKTPAKMKGKKQAKTASRKPAPDESVLPKVEVVSPAPVPVPDAPAPSKSAPAPKPGDGSAGGEQ